MMLKQFSSCVATLCLSVPVFAQNQFITQPNGGFGTPIGATTISVISVALGFNFTMPGGSIVTDVDVHTTGRIMEVGAEPSDGSESVAELLNDPPAIMIRWDNNTFPGAASDIYFATDSSTVATITWAEVRFGAGSAATAQAQLFADGRIVLVYDSRIANDDGIVGVSPGNGATNPGNSNLSDSVMAPIVSTSPVVYEDFDFTIGFNDLDLQSTALEFVPNGVGGVNGWTVNGNSGVVDVLPFARVEDNGGGCFRPFTTIFTPDGVGGYIVSSGASAFDSNIGPSLGASSDDTITLFGVDLGFVFPFPGGTTDQFVRIDNNGRVIPDSSAGVGDFTPTIGDLEGDGYPMIVAWSDLNVLEPGSGNIHFNSAPGSATITWNNVKQFDGGDTNLGVTHQFTLLSDGTIFITIEDYRGFNTQRDQDDDDLLIGISDGVTVGTTEIDITTPTVVMSVPAIYEFWSSADGSEPVDFLIDQPRLVSLSVPSFGGSWGVRLEDVPASSTLGFILIGFFPTDLRLDILGIPCSLNVLEATGPAGVALIGGGNSATFSLPISTDPVLRGLSVYLQGAADGAPFTPLPLFFTNSIAGVIGD